MKKIFFIIVVIAVLFIPTPANAKSCAGDCKPNKVIAEPPHKIMVNHNHPIKHDDDLVEKEDIWWGFPKEPEIHWCIPKICDPK